MATKTELLAKAKLYNITGRHEMTKDQLESAVGVYEMQVKAETPTIDKTAIKNVVRRYPSLRARDAEGKIIRHGNNLSGNQPFKHKFYYLNKSVGNPALWTDGYKEAFNAAPKQVRGLLEYLASAKIFSPRESMIGSDIAGYAKALKFVTSKIEDDQLFAYYRRALEVLGIIHAVGKSDDEDAEADESEDEDSDDEE